MHQVGILIKLFPVNHLKNPPNGARQLTKKDYSNQDIQETFQETFQHQSKSNPSLTKPITAEQRQITSTQLL